MRERWGVLISGNGSTLQSVLDLRDRLDVAVVISSHVAAYGLTRARRAGVGVEILPAELKGQANRQKAEEWILQTLERYNTQKIFLAGFMRIISAEFIRRYEDRIFNIHPSLLPLYKGLEAFEQAMQAGDSHAGVSIHHVAPDVDSGQIIGQRRFEIPKHREEGLSHLWLHIQEQRLMRDVLAKRSLDGLVQGVMDA